MKSPRYVPDNIPKISATVKFPQSDGHTEKIEIKKEGLGGVQWKTKEREGHLTKNSRKKQPV